MKKKIIFTVTNDLSYDQRMIRICHSLSQYGYQILLVGTIKKNSIPLSNSSFQQKRLNCLFTKGKWFYIEYNLRLLLFLLVQKTDCICAIDLDTILPCLWVSSLKKIPRVYDAHELFCEMKEVVSRPHIHRIWKSIEKFSVPKFRHAYTVNQPIADEFHNMYGLHVDVIRNAAEYFPEADISNKERYLLYQGAVNEGRCLEFLIPAMQCIDRKLIICGDGNFMNQARSLVIKHHLEDKIIFKGMIPPSQLKEISNKAHIGINLCESNALSTYYSLANKFFDYIQSATPQICVNFPAYKELNNEYKVGLLIDDITPEGIAKSINHLLDHPTEWNLLHENCKRASLLLNWQAEEKKLIHFYQKILD